VFVTESSLYFLGDIFVPLEYFNSVLLVSNAISVLELSLVFLRKISEGQESSFQASLFLSLHGGSVNPT
jgi:hypothetical protein